jgi:hypothetical protein
LIGCDEEEGGGSVGVTGLFLVSLPLALIDEVMGMVSAADIDVGDF